MVLQKDFLSKYTPCWEGRDDATSPLSLTDHVYVIRGGSTRTKEWWGRIPFSFSFSSPSLLFLFPTFICSCHQKLTLAGCSTCYGEMLSTRSNSIAKKPPLHGKPLKETGILATSKKIFDRYEDCIRKKMRNVGLLKHINQRDSGDTEPHTCDKAWIMANLKLVYLWFLQIMFRILDFFLSYLFPNRQKFSALPALSIRFIFYHPFIHLYKT